MRSNNCDSAPRRPARNGTESVPYRPHDRHLRTHSFRHPLCPLAREEKGAGCESRRFFKQHSAAWPRADEPERFRLADGQTGRISFCELSSGMNSVLRAASGMISVSLRRGRPKGGRRPQERLGPICENLGKNRASYRT